MAHQDEDEEEQLLRSVALQNAQSILAARQRAEQELVRTKEALEARTTELARSVAMMRATEEALRDETRILELLYRTGTVIASTLDVQTLLQSIADAATQLSGAELGGFFYDAVGPTDVAFLLYALSGAPREAFERFDHARAADLFGPAFRGEGPIRIDDVLLDSRYGTWAPYHEMPPAHLPVRSYLAVPVISRSGETIGGLFFGHNQTAVFTDRAERLVVGVAAQASVAIDNARLYGDVKRVADERARLLETERAIRVELERVGLMKDEFLGTLSHELRTPLNAILGWSELLLEQSTEDTELAQGLEKIARNARAQARLVEDLLDMNRIISGKIRLDVQRADLTTVLDAAVDAVRPSAEAKGVRLRKIIDPTAGPVAGDPNRLQQVVWNLLSNAVKFTPKGGRVDVVLERVNSHIEITINDSGMGIDADFLPHVFERFRQADSSITRKTGGLGLGLAIVKQLVELHGGSIRVESPGEGQGCTFVVSLPLQVVREAPGRQHPTGAKPRQRGQNEIDLSGIKVLVVDDEYDARELVKAVLSRSKAHVITASSADDCLDLLRSERPDVLISDIGMPVKDGYQLMREVRALPAAEGGRIPAIALTAFARSEDRTKAMLAGYQQHLAKPVESRELAAAVRSLAGRVGDARDSQS